MTHRTEQVNSTLQRAVQTVLARGLSDPRIRGLVSVTRVRVDDDLSHATVYVSVMPEEHAELTMHGLRAAAARIRSDVGRAVRIRRMPGLSFRLDDSIKQQARLERSLGE